MNGRVIITTQRRDSAIVTPERALIEISPFDPQESARYLADRLGHGGQRLQQAELLAEDLGHLPLAMAQAAAFMDDRGLTCAQYRQRWQEKRLNDILPDDHALPDDQLMSVATTVALSVERAGELSPQGLAVSLLELLSVLDPAGIPLVVLASCRARSLLSWHRPVQVEPDDVTDAAHCLRRLSLITLSDEDPHQTAGVHAMVQRATRDRMSFEQHGLAVMVLADAIDHVWPRSQCCADVGHMMVATASALVNGNQSFMVTDKIHPLVFKLACSVSYAGDPQSAHSLLSDVLAIAAARLDPHHHDIVAARTALATFRGEAGDWAGAIEMLEQLLRDVDSQTGQAHSHAEEIRFELAKWLGADGRATDAIQLVDGRLTGPRACTCPNGDHDVLDRHQRGILRGQTGDPDGAVTELRQVISDLDAIHGPLHADTLHAWLNLAYWYEQAGNHDASNVIYEYAIPIMRKVLGDDHQLTLTARLNHIGQNAHNRDPAVALAGLMDLLEQHLRVFGPEHSATLAVRNHTAIARARNGDLDEAHVDLVNLLKQIVKMYGPRHPFARETRKSLDWVGHLLSHRAQGHPWPGSLSGFEYWRFAG